MPSQKILIKHPIIKQYVALRKRAGMNQQDVADLVDISRQSVAYYESGRQIPNIVMMHKLIVAVGGQGITTYGWE